MGNYISKCGGENYVGYEGGGAAEGVELTVGFGEVGDVIGCIYADVSGGDSRTCKAGFDERPEEMKDDCVIIHVGEEHGWCKILS